MTEKWRHTNEQWDRDMRAAGHDPVVYEGKIDMFALDADPHNGPACQKCGWSVCEHCHGSKPIPECEGETQ